MTDEFLTLADAAKLAGVSRATLWRRLREPGREVQVYQAQQDRRVRLVKRSDIEELMKPLPVKYTPASEGKATAGYDPAAA